MSTALLHTVLAVLNPQKPVSNRLVLAVVPHDPLAQSGPDDISLRQSGLVAGRTQKLVLRLADPQSQVHRVLQHGRRLASRRLLFLHRHDVLDSSQRTISVNVCIVQRSRD
jgi:hypothetical protein